MPNNSHNQHANVERHDGQHDQIHEPDPDRMHPSLHEPAAGLARGPDEAAVVDPLVQDREGEDHDERQHVHPRAGARPALEEDLGVGPPEEGHVGPAHRHVHGHVVARVHAHRGVVMAMVHVHGDQNWNFEDNKDEVWG